MTGTIRARFFSAMLAVDVGGTFFASPPTNVSSPCMILPLPPIGPCNFEGKYPPAKPGALGFEPLEAVDGVADAAPEIVAA